VAVRDPQASQLTLRPARLEDAADLGRICYEAFRSIASRHNITPAFPSPDVATARLVGLLSHDGFYKIVAERDGEVVGSNFIDERSPIAGVGPITIDPGAQDRGIGRRLMHDALERSASRNVAGVRLVQAAYYTRALALYAKMGFVVREPLALMQGGPIATAVPGRMVRAAGEADLMDCTYVCRVVHGHDRADEVADAIRAGTTTVVEHDGRITGYATTVALFGHAVGETVDDLKALVVAAPSFGGRGIIVPARSPLFAWCLDRGLQIKQVMTLMSVGIYNEPMGAYLPSITY
jgi:GNAT superfamily N-acetyltransferase